MLFATNRVLVEGPTPVSNNRETYELPRSVNFDLDNNQAEQSIYFCQRNSENQYEEIGSTQFFQMLADTSAQDIVFYIHGYSNLPEPSVFPRTLELQGLFNHFGSSEVLVVPLIWPCDNDFGALQDYFDDQIAADASAFAFMRFFEKFLTWMANRVNTSPTTTVPFEKNLHLLTHSMGARVLAGALNRSVEYFQVNGFPSIFRNIFLSAPDLLNESLEPNQPGQWMSAAARNVVVYYASDDWALRASKVLNLGNFVASRRLGQTGPEDLARVAKNVFALDCGDFNNDYDLAGHSYFAGDENGDPGLLLRHMQMAIASGRVKIPTGQQQAVLNEVLLA